MKNIAGVMLLGMLSACGTSGVNTVTGGNVADDVVVGADPNTSAAEKFAFNTDTGLVLNSLDYDADADELVLNNIPFDTSTGIYENTTPAGSAFETFANGWGLYQNDERAEEGRQEFFAVFKESSTGNALASAVATGDFIEDGNGGATAQRLGVQPSLPTTGIIFYSGDYSAVRTLFGDNGRDDIQLVTGTADISIDFDDFDITGDIIGRIQNRRVYDNAGNFLGNLEALGLAEAQIDRETATINSSSAGNADGTLSGDWEGVFAGPDGEEIAGYLVLVGTFDDDADDSTPALGLREIGAFIVER